MADTKLKQWGGGGAWVSSFCGKKNFATALEVDWTTTAQTAQHSLLQQLQYSIFEQAELLSLFLELLYPLILSCYSVCFGTAGVGLFLNIFKALFLSSHSVLFLST